MKRVFFTWIGDPAEDESHLCDWLSYTANQPLPESGGERELRIESMTALPDGRVFVLISRWDTPEEAA